MSDPNSLLLPHGPGSLTVMGTGTSVGVPVVGCHCHVCTSENPQNHRTRSGVLVRAPEGNFVIDTSPELRLQLLRAKADLVHAAIFTHSHADHIFGLDDLRLFGHILEQDIPLYCEEATENQIRRSFSYAFETDQEKAHKYAIPRLKFHRIGLEPFRLLGLTIQPIRLLHGRLPVLGFRIHNVAFCTDVSRIPDESWPLLQELDVLILDALREKPHPTHFSLSESVEVVQKVRPKRAYFTHISHFMEHEETNSKLPEGIELAYDGLTISYG